MYNTYIKMTFGKGFVAVNKKGRKTPIIYKKKTQAVEVRKIQKQVRHLTKLAAISVSADEDNNGTAITTAGTVQYLHSQIAAIGLGDAEQGTKVMYKSIDLRVSAFLVLSSTVVNFNKSTLTVPVGGRIRCLLVRDMDNAGALPTLFGTSFNTSNILINTSTAGFNYLAIRNRGTSKRFKILYDSTKIVNDYTGTLEWHIKKRFTNTVTEYGATGGTVADAQTGQLFLCLIPDGNLIGSVNGATVNTNYQSQLMYELN